MNKIIFSERSWQEYVYWQSKDKKTLKRINQLLKDIVRFGNIGIGKAEPLRHQDGWSRRIDDSNRLVYSISEDMIEVIQCKGHYDD